jgi:hypothetical protein
VGLTSQATYSDASGAARVYSGLIMDDPLPHIFNIFETDVQTYTTASVAVLWTLSETGASSPAIAPGVARTYIARYPTSASANNARGVALWTTTAATTDMLGNTAADGSGTNVTASIGISVSKSSETMEITLTNNTSATAYITKLQARGTAITADDPASIKQEDATPDGLREADLAQPDEIHPGHRRGIGLGGLQSLDLQRPDRRPPAFLFRQPGHQRHQ